MHFFGMTWSQARTRIERGTSWIAACSTRVKAGRSQGDCSN